MLGLENAKMVVAQMGIYDDEDKTEYIREVGERLLRQLPDRQFEYQFNIVPEFTPNAFALPGGYIFITTGLLPIIESEDELACILAHEIIHAHKRHSVKQLKRSVLPRLLEVPGDLIGVVNKDLGDLFNSPIQTSNALLKASYGRGFETESDIEGIKLAAAAGYNPDAMIPILKRMSAAIETATGRAEAKSYFNDHPYTPERVKTVEQNSSRIRWVQSEGISNSFNREIDSLLFGDHPNKGIVRDNQFYHPDLDFSIAFPENWEIENKPSNVGAYHPERKAAVYLSMENDYLSPEKAGLQLLNELKPNYRKKLTGNGPYTMNGKNGYLVSFEETIKKQTVYAYVLWLPLGGKLFKLTGISPIEYRSQLEQTAKSLRVLNSGEKKSFTIDMVRIVEASKGETIVSLGERTGNHLNDQLTGVINSRDIEDILEEGEEIKVVRRYLYVIEK